MTPVTTAQIYSLFEAIELRIDGDELLDRFAYAPPWLSTDSPTWHWPPRPTPPQRAYTLAVAGAMLGLAR